MVTPVIQYAKANNQKFLKDLFALLEIPSISTLSNHQKDINQAASWLVNYLKSINLNHVKLVKTPGNPLVYADWLNAPNKPTLLIYGHYDVQPPDPVSQWKTPPFKPTIKNNRLYGRGTSDSKCQHFIHLAAIQSYLKTHHKLPLNIKIVLEGEEEVGSKNFATGIKQNKKLFAHDISIIADFGMPELNTPAIGYGLRGIIYTEISLTGPKCDLHSGIYGGIIDNPAQILCQILSKLKDKNNRITIPGFYKNVAKIDQAEKKLLASYPQKKAQIKKITGVKTLISEPGIHESEQRKVRPSLDINGMYSGFTGEGAKTIIPSSATAKISMRLVPKQNPQKIFTAFKKYIKKLTPPTVTVSIREPGADPAIVTDYNHPKIKAISQALTQTFNKKPVFNRSGGSISAVSHIVNAYKKPTAILGFSPPDDNIHSPNENFYLPNFQKGIEATIRMFQLLA